MYKRQDEQEPHLYALAANGERVGVCSGAGHVKRECPSKRKFPRAEVIKILQDLTSAHPSKFAQPRTTWQPSPGSQSSVRSTEACSRFLARRGGRNRPSQQGNRGGGNTFLAEVSGDGEVYDSESGDYLGNLSSLEQSGEQPAQSPEANLLAADQPAPQAVQGKAYITDRHEKISAHSKPSYKEPLVWSAETMMNLALVEDSGDVAECQHGKSSLDPYSSWPEVEDGQPVYQGAVEDPVDIEPCKENRWKAEHVQVTSKQPRALCYTTSLRALGWVSPVLLIRALLAARADTGCAGDCANSASTPRLC